MSRPSRILLVLGLPLLLAWGASRVVRDDSLQGRARSSLAQTTGSLRVPGLERRVEVIRDRWGIPHLYASSEADLFLAQGFVQAQDRLFQMEMWRRSTQGRLAELLGPRLVERDRLTRLVSRYRGDMDAEWASYDDRARSTAFSFVRGVNAYVAHLDGRRPLEFELAGMDLEPWSPEDLLARAEAFGMSGNADSEVWRAQIVRAAGVDLATRLRPPDPPVALSVPPGLPLAAVTDGLQAALALIGASAPFGDDGSNNWVVSGRRSATGRPLLANDPHRALDHPSLRYLIHLEAPGIRLLGAVVPWFPGIAIGHNERVAWGLTIFRIDAQDLYVEELDPSDPLRYRVPGGWERMTVAADTIRVKGSGPVDVTLRYTRHGPVVHEDRARGLAWALRWTGQEAGTAGYLSGLALGRAESALDFRRALRRWRMPGENFVFADVDGAIGYQAAGLAPVRRGWSGLLPVPGGAGAFEWQGFVPAEELPSAADPASGFLATANHNVLPPGYRHPIGYEWAERYRLDRIEEVLRDRGPFTVSDFEALQHDVEALPARALLPLLRALDPPTPRLRAARDLLLSWDRRMTRESAAASLYALWEVRLAWGFAQREARAAGLEPGVVLRKLTLGAALSGVARPGRENEVLALAALDASVAQLERHLGPSMERWRWGDVHHAWFTHPLAVDDATRELFNRGPVSRDGYGNTVNSTGGGAVDQTSGASFRAIFDLANWDRSVATSVPGQSGQPGSPHFDDLLPYWTEGRYFPLAFSRRKVEEVAEARLLLEPGGDR